MTVNVKSSSSANRRYVCWKLFALNKLNFKLSKEVVNHTDLSY